MSEIEQKVFISNRLQQLLNDGDILHLKLDPTFGRILRQIKSFKGLNGKFKGVTRFMKRQIELTV